MKSSLGSSFTHITVMPCYDKKLEAVRPSDPKEVDSVLATHELVDLMKSADIDFGVEVGREDSMPE